MTNLGNSKFKSQILFFSLALSTGNGIFPFKPEIRLNDVAKDNSNVRHLNATVTVVGLICTSVDETKMHPGAEVINKFKSSTAMLLFIK